MYGLFFDQASANNPVSMAKGRVMAQYLFRKDRVRIEEEWLGKVFQAYSHTWVMT
jgi:hypothetical protein